MSTKASKLIPDSPKTLQIRVFESVFVANPSKKPLTGWLEPIVMPKIEPWMVAHILVPIQAVLFSPRPPTETQKRLTIKAIAW